MYFIQHCFICRPSDSTVLAELNPRPLQRLHWQSDALDSFSENIVIIVLTRSSEPKMSFSHFRCLTKIILWIFITIIVKYENCKHFDDMKNI